jgi:Kef-type K+ transport system membrane component KefB
MSPFEMALQFFLQLAVILGACRLLGVLARWCGQPQVIAEMIAGILLGPSVFGLWDAEWQQRLFRPEMKPLLYATSQVGLALYMFLVGLEFRTDLFRSRMQGAAMVSVAGMVAPLGLGALVAWWLSGMPGFFSAEIGVTQAMLYLGASMCITAFPVLARIILERGLTGTALGTLALAAGAVDDAAAWCLLAFVLATLQGDSSIALWAVLGGAAYVAVLLTVGRFALRSFGGVAERQHGVSHELLSLTLMLVMLGSLATDFIGLHAVFGAFILGCAMPRGLFVEETTRKLEPAITCLLLPVFFTYSGLNTRLDLVTTPQLWGIAAVVLVAACLGKGGACWAAARFSGEDQPTSLAVGVLMNARGLMELIILNIGLERGLITPRLFSIMVVMAIVTTLMASPLFEWVYGREARRRGDLAALEAA